MTRHSGPQRRLMTVLAFAMLAGAAATTERTAAQTVAAPALKAAFLFNFAKFAEWPAEAVASGSPLTLCVLGDEEVGGALAEIVRSRPSDNASMSVRRMTDERSVRACHLLYRSHVDLTRAMSVLETIKGLPVLTVSDLGGFAESGGVAAFFEEDGKMRFAINTRASERVRLRISSRLLSLARIVREEGNVVQR